MRRHDSIYASKEDVWQFLRDEHPAHAVTSAVRTFVQAAGRLPCATIASSPRLRITSAPTAATMPVWKWWSRRSSRRLS
jgi:hypothetical protein